MPIPPQYATVRTFPAPSNLATVRTLPTPANMATVRTLPAPPNVATVQTPPAPSQMSTWFTNNRAAISSGALSAGLSVMQSMTADAEAKIERQRIQAFQNESRQNYLDLDAQLRGNVAQTQEELAVRTRVAIANEEKDAAYRRGIANLTAADRGVSGQSVQDLKTALDIQEVESINRLEDDLRKQGIAVSEQAMAIRDQSIRQLREIEATPLPSRVNPWMAGLQALASGAQSYYATSSANRQAYRQGAAGAAAQAP